jgi:XTP/dITP diphosphohydrolase
VAVLVSPKGERWSFEGKISGRLALAPRGTPRSKLPYDVVFIPEGMDRTFAEMADEEKNSLSHRSRAFRKLKEFLAEKFKK